MKESTLLFLLDEDKVLLAMKKRGFGAGRWNGVGGKIDEGETVQQATIRECQEEIGVTPLILEKVAHHTFLQADGSQLIVHAFICTKWQGEPTETEEMAPRWFKQTEIPFDAMWEDDEHWLPLALDGVKLITQFTFDANDHLLDKTMQITTPEHVLLQV